MSDWIEGADFADFLLALELEDELRLRDFLADDGRFAVSNGCLNNSGASLREIFAPESPVLID